MRYVVGLLVAYLLAAPLTSRISLNLLHTEWTHLMTYVWWAGAWVVWCVIIFAAAVLLTVWAND